MAVPTSRRCSRSCALALSSVMVLMLLLAAIGPANSSSPALGLCRPVLERKAGGEMDRITVDKSSRWRGTTTLNGRITVLVGMGTPAPRSASAHHLIRADYRYRCWVRHGRVTKATIEQ